jgi:hypothetical protein
MLHKFISRNICLGFVIIISLSHRKDFKDGIQSTRGVMLMEHVGSIRIKHVDNLTTSSY